MIERLGIFSNLFKIIRIMRLSSKLIHKMSNIVLKLIFVKWVTEKSFISDLVASITLKD